MVRMHFAHKTLLTLRPLTITVTFCRLGRKVRLVARREKLRLWPKVVVFPQFSHFAIVKIPFKIAVETLGSGTIPRSDRKFYHKAYLLTRIIVKILGKRAPMTDGTNPLGNIYVYHRAIATIASQSAMSSYGVVGLAAKNIAEGLAQALVKDPTLGIDVRYDGSTIQIELYIIVEYGTRIKSVAASVADNVRYQVEKTIGLPVTAVNVHVRGLRVSNPD